MTATAKRKLTALAIDLLYITMLCIGVSRAPYSKIADLSMLAIYLVLMAMLSFHCVRDWMSGRQNTFLRRCRRWLTDDYPDTN